MYKLNQILESDKFYNKRLIILISIGIIFQLSLIFKNVDQIINYQTDDSFFYYTIARNIIQGQGPVVNEGIATNGFHPLYVVILVPIFALFYPIGINAPLYAVLSLFIVLNIATAVFIYKIAKDISDKNAGLLAAAMWVLNPYIIRFYVSGMEVPIQIFFLSILTYILVRRWETVDFSTKQSIVIGALLGLIFLSRMDGAFIAIGVAGVIAGRKFLKKGGQTLSNISEWSDIFIMTATALGLSSPWFIYQYITLERITPISREAIKFEVTTLTPVDQSTLILEVIRSFAASVANTILSLNYSPITAVAIIVIGAAPVGLVTILNYKKTIYLIRKLDFLFLSALLYYPFYTFVQLRIRWYYLIYTSFIVVLTISVSLTFLIEEISNRSQMKLPQAKTVMSIIAVLSIINIVVAGIPMYQGEERQLSVKRDVGDCLESELDAETKIAALGGGGYQYYDTEHDILLLAPVINPESLEAMKTNSLDEYISNHNTEYMINHKRGIRAVDRQLQNHELVAVKKWDGPGGFEPWLAKVVPSGDNANATNSTIRCGT